MPTLVERTFFFRDAEVSPKQRLGEKGASLFLSDVTCMVVWRFGDSPFEAGLTPHPSWVEFAGDSGGIPSTATAIYQGVDVPNNERLAVVGSGTNVYSVVPFLSTAPTSIKAGLSSGQEFGICEMDQKLFFFNGKNTPFKATIDAVPTVTNIGLPRLSVGASTATVTVGGNVKGTVRYYVADVSVTTEGALSAEFGVVDCGDGASVALAVLPAFTTALRIYRSTANGAQPRYLAEISSGTTYTDNTADEDLGGYPEAHGDPPPITCLPAIVHYNRIFTAGRSPHQISGTGGAQGATNTLFWSDFGSPESFFTTSVGNWIEVQGDDGDVIVALAKEPSGIVLFKRNHIYRLIGRNPEDFQLTEVTLPDPQGRAGGAYGIRSVVSVGNALAFAWAQGVYLYSDGQIAKISNQLDGVFTSSTQNLRLGFWPKKQWLYVEQVFSQKIWIFDLFSARWIGGLKLIASASDGTCWGRLTDAATGLEERLVVSARNSLYSLPEPETFTFGGNLFLWSSTGVTLAPFYGTRDSALKRFVYVDLAGSLISSGVCTVTVSAVFDGVTESFGSFDFSADTATPDETKGGFKHRIFVDQVAHYMQLTLSVLDSGVAPVFQSVSFGYLEYPAGGKRY